MEIYIVPHPFGIIIGGWFVNCPVVCMWCCDKSSRVVGEQSIVEVLSDLMTNDTDSELPFLHRSWSFRDKIDKFYQRAKDDLGFDQYQVRSEKAISRHWYLVFLIFSFFTFHRQCGSFTKWSVRLSHTFGQMLDTVRTKLMLHFQHWCQQNPDRWHQFLHAEKGIPATAIDS